MDYGQFVKKLAVPEGFTVPTRLTYEDVVAVAITREHLADDVRGINASMAIIRQTRGGRWPTEEVTEEYNYVDLVWHECEFRELDSFTYVLYDTGGRYLGCLYLYPMGRRKPLTEELLKYDVDASWWVTTEAYAEGYYPKLYAALRQWMAEEFPWSEVYYSNAEIPG